MDFLFSIDPKSHDGNTTGFVCPDILVHEWRIFFSKILPNNKKLAVYKVNLVNNLSYRMQYLEFLHAQISYHYFCCLDSKRPTLHQSILRIMIQNYVIYTYSIFEGLGAYFYRHETGKDKRKLQFTNWNNHLVNFFVESQYSKRSEFFKRSRRKKLHTLLNRINQFRGRIHLDHPELDNDFNSFNKEVFRTSSLCLRVFIKKNMIYTSKYPNLVRIK